MAHHDWLMAVLCEAAGLCMLHLGPVDLVQRWAGDDKQGSVLVGCGPAAVTRPTASVPASSHLTPSAAEKTLGCCVPPLVVPA